MSHSTVCAELKDHAQHTHGTVVALTNYLPAPHNIQDAGLLFMTNLSMTANRGTMDKGRKYKLRRWDTTTGSVAG